MDLMKLGELKAGADKGATMLLRHPVDNSVLTDDAGKEMSITFAGKDSDLYRKAEKLIGNRRINRMKTTRRYTSTVEEQETDTIELLAACTMDWYLVVEGKTPECNAIEARKLYSTAGIGPVIVEQALAFIEDRASFLTN